MVANQLLCFLFKEQSHFPSVLLDQTKPEGFRPKVKSDPTKHKGKGIVPVVTHVFVYIGCKEVQ